MKHVSIALTALLLFVQCASGQARNFKQEAAEEFKAERFPEAIELLKQAQKATPDDPEVYYLLGVYTHYNAYDSRPLQGYDAGYSEQIFAYLDKAIELRPDYGDAKYFYGAECSANAFIYMQHYRADSLRMIYKKAYDKGAYPAWLLELGRNRLGQCDKDAILFAGGNPDFDVSLYLQLHENFRTDVTVIPIGNIDRPWYVEFLKKGLPGAVRSVSINLTKEQIYDIRPFKWDTTTLTIPVPGIMKRELGMRGDMQWEVVPDQVSQRPRQEDSTRRRTLLSPQRAMLLQIVEDNAWKRPIYFSRGTVAELMGGLDAYAQDCGLVARLLPLKTKGTKWNVDVEKLEKLVMNPANLRYYPSVMRNDIPRISGTTTFYHVSAYLLAQAYGVKKDKKKLDELLALYERYLKVGLYPESEEYFRTRIRKIIKDTHDGNS